ncbi:glycerol-3-phosphate dehydrogenase [Alphaproteobacteria bacterium]|nr:glycerol-3-phosphate dehydrogenase [Alphaproteobacteria bacterium]
MTDIYDIFIIGGGINGAGIARDASGRGLKVYLAEKGKVGSATSSWSSKLIHGGLRYLENYEFKLVAESLREREVITRIAPKITKPLPFVIPYSKKLRSKLLIRLGLFLYDNLGGKTKIPKSSKIYFNKKYKNILQSKFVDGFQYYDVQVDDKKLVEMNIDDSKKMGATILEDTKVIDAKRNENFWEITLDNNEVIKSKILINAAGPWINETVNNVLKINTNKSIRLVRGSHIITKKLYDEDIAFTLQNDDNRIVFVIPYKEEFSLIGTTEVDVNTPDNPSISDDEKIYLINSINNHFVKQISQVDIIDTYSGIRPLIEDFKEASKVSRDYVFDLNIQNIGSPLLNIYGGKLTTYRKLSEKVMEELTPYLPDTKTKNWTATKQL